MVAMLAITHLNNTGPEIVHKSTWQSHMAAGYMCLLARLDVYATSKIPWMRMFELRLLLPNELPCIQQNWHTIQTSILPDRNRAVQPPSVMTCVLQV